MEDGIVMESVWVAVAFVFFVVLVWKKAGAVLANMLDERSEKIRTDLEEAKTLRDAAINELQNYQRLHREAADEAKAIIKNAEITAERIRETAEKNANDVVISNEVFGYRNGFDKGVAKLYPVAEMDFEVPVGGRIVLSLRPNH